MTQLILAISGSLLGVAIVCIFLRGMFRQDERRMRNWMALHMDQSKPGTKEDRTARC